MITYSSIRVAIVGAGCSGAAMAIVLARNPRFDVHVFEATPELDADHGSAVGMSWKSPEYLKEILGRRTELRELLKAAGAVALSAHAHGSDPVHMLVKKFVELSGGTEEDGYGRTGQWPSFLRELVAHVPKERLHWNKKLVEVAQNSDSRVSIAFEDGTKENFDLVIGCDGTFSTTRHYVLEDFPDKIEPNSAGFWDCRIVVPIEMAKKVFGEDWFIEPKENAFAGDVAFATMHSVDDGAGLECAICAVEKDPVPSRERLVTREFLEDVFSAWFDGKLAYYAKGMIDCILKKEKSIANAQYEHNHTPQYARGAVCLVGDAAHVSSPWMAAGIPQGWEDVLILGSTLLPQVKRPSDLALALQAYGETRLERAQKCIDLSREMGSIMCGQDPEVGLDPEKLKPAVGSRFYYVEDLDLEAYKQNALDRMKELQGK